MNPSELEAEHIDAFRSMLEGKLHRGMEPGDFNDDFILGAATMLAAVSPIGTPAHHFIQPLREAVTAAIRDASERD